MKYLFTYSFLATLILLFSCNNQPRKYKFVGAESEGLIIVQDHNDKMGFIDSRGNVIISCKYKLVSPFHEGLAGVTEDLDQWYFINKRDEQVIGTFSRVDNFENGISKVYINNKFGYIDRQGNEVIKIDYEDIYDLDGRGKFKNTLSENMLLVKKGKQYGFLDLSILEEVIPCVYQEATIFSEGLAVVGKCKEGYYGSPVNCLYGYINKKGEVVIDFKFKSAFSFSHGIATVEDFSGRKFTIDKKGDKILPYNSVELVSGFIDGIGIGKKTNGNLIYINTKFEQIIPGEYDKCSEFENGEAVVKKGYREYSIDKNGNCIKGCL